MSRTTHHGITDMRKAALKRLADARRLLGSKENCHARGARYLAGYAIECKLKAIAMEIYACKTLADLAEEWQVERQAVYTHGLEVFARQLPLWRRLQGSDVWRDFTGQVNRWNPAWRYDGRDLHYAEARVFLDAVTRVYKWLESNKG